MGAALMTFLAIMGVWFFQIDVSGRRREGGRGGGREGGRAGLEGEGFFVRPWKDKT
jgi:hypothetical protein